MSKRGKATKIRGIYETDVPGTWVLRTLGVEQTVNGSLAEAHVALEALRQQVRNPAMNEAEAPPKMTVLECAPQWLARLKKRKPNTKQKWIDDRIRILDLHVLPFWEKYAVSEILPRDIGRWEEWMSQQKQVRKKSEGKPYSQGTLRTAFSTFRTMMAWGCMEESCVNPMLGLRFGLEHSKAKPKDWLTQEELGRVLGALQRHASPDMHVLITCLFATGARHAEVSAWHWEDVDLEAGTVRIERSQVEGCVGPPKTEATRRLIYLLPQVVELLRAHKEWQRTEGPDLPANAGSKVFPSSKGEYRHSSVVRKPLAAACAIAGVKKHLTAHCGRKTANNLLLTASDGQMARAILGHANAEMTFTYHGADAEARRAASAKAFGTALDKLGPATGTSPEVPALN